jgi:hypothetical protein
VVDITGFTDKKIEYFGLQFSILWSNIKEPESPISLKLSKFKLSFRDLGRLVGVDHAEGFTVERYLAVNSLTDLK